MQLVAMMQQVTGNITSNKLNDSDGSSLVQISQMLFMSHNAGCVRVLVSSLCLAESYLGF